MLSEVEGAFHEKAGALGQSCKEVEIILSDVAEKR